VLAISIFPLIYRLIPHDFRAQNPDRRAMQHRSLERVVVDGQSWSGNQTPAVVIGILRPTRCRPQDACILRLHS
jgi:hypothetical protein